jgi:alanine racemase
MTGPEGLESPNVLAAAHVTVRLGRIAANFARVREAVSPARVAPVVKADAYGLGLWPVAGALAQAGAEEFFVARSAEGMSLRAHLPSARIFVLDGILPGMASALHAHRLVPVLNARAEIDEWAEEAGRGKHILDAALQIDTGMNRSGLAASELSGLRFTGLNLVLAMSHLACADVATHSMNRLQLERFRAALGLLPPVTASLAASAGIALGKDYLFDMVRPGLALYGGNPVAASPNPNPNPYRIALRFTAPVLQIRRLAPGDTVGYGASFTARRPTVLAIVALGYADGLIRASAARGHAAIGGVRLPFAGRISMDLLALDASEVPEDLLVRGAPVEFLGDTISLEDAAEAAGTINHEILTSLSPRARRVYVEGVA